MVTCGKIILVRRNISVVVGYIYVITQRISSFFLLCSGYRATPFISVVGVVGLVHPCKKGSISVLHCCVLCDHLKSASTPPTALLSRVRPVYYGISNHTSVHARM